jgi:DNA-binding XRE family transcriptional regulator
MMPTKDIAGSGSVSKPYLNKPFKFLHWQMIQDSMNRLKEVRESLLVSKAELARKANISPITIARIEKGLPCRMETQRKILLALGLQLSEKHKIFNN